MLIARSEESYHVCPIVCTLEASKIKKSGPCTILDLAPQKKVSNQYQFVPLVKVRWRQGDAEIVYI